MVLMDFWLCCFVVVFMVVLMSFVVVLVVVFGGDARGGWCWFLVRINVGFSGG